MAAPTRANQLRHIPYFEDMPILYEDEEEGDMGESNVHVDSDEILHVCLKAHLADRPDYRVFSNMNCYYRKDPPHPRTGSLPYVSPDNMVVLPNRPLGEVVSSYTIGRDGPAPLLTAEVLSERSAQQRDLDAKVKLYAQLGIAEYILVDVTAKYLPQKLLLKRLQPDGTYQDERDPDGGVTSRLGFRLIIDTDGQLRVVDAKTGKRYPRPNEAIQLEERVRELEAELARLKEKAKPKKRKREQGK